jgi:hypothetical protein
MPLAFVIRHSDLFRHSDFDLRHSVGGRSLSALHRT